MEFFEDTPKVVIDNRSGVTNTPMMSTVEWMTMVENIQKENQRFKQAHCSVFGEEYKETPSLTRTSFDKPGRINAKVTRRLPPSENACDDLKAIMARQRKEQADRKKLAKKQKREGENNKPKKEEPKVEVKVEVSSIVKAEPAED
eukprot:NODE_4775_length_763_cov_36.089636_g4427_i0.p1 GENE.NODE_4775_length_763_cov_36.089636_g4427_i0~~NODE_4775_length_763_cov_36.089636_g4427_i0.p1  ORF type:complete len:145 (+),score=34.34 NODE_4775_length_763_cov_36.089636_g4427_i0:161-595(+)